MNQIKKFWSLPSSEELCARADELWESGQFSDAAILRSAVHERHSTIEDQMQVQEAWDLSGNTEKARMLRRLDRCLTSLWTLPDTRAILEDAYRCIAADQSMTTRQERVLAKSERKLKAQLVQLTISVRKTMDLALAIYNATYHITRGTRHTLNKVFRNYADGVLLRSDLIYVEAEFKDDIAFVRLFEFIPGTRVACWFNQDEPKWSKQKPFAKIAMVLDEPFVFFNTSKTSTSILAFSEGTVVVTVMLDDGRSQLVQLSQLKPLDSMQDH